MLKINGTNFSFSNIGLFESDGDWIHPTVTVDSYEIICVVSGEVALREEEMTYRLRAGEMILLDREREHGGVARSTGYTSFYWLHFYTDHIESFRLGKQFSAPAHAKRFFAELMHLQEHDRTVAELALARFLLEMGIQERSGNRTAHEVLEYIRINAHRPLTVGDVARRFGYSADHVSRILKREFGYDTKTAIVKKRLEHIESLLINTEHTVKELALQCGFEEENKFVKFFKYHEGISPSQFRNRYFYVHMNSK
ncbi:MAG: helix-turn-helix transcriptional regulator [Clostridia bacterium]|nr:helix-turn-helix transcriptional regulator [Clostridia bacterium]